MAQKTLLVVESPNKIKKISSYLSKNFTVRASYGHIMDLTIDKKHRLGIDIENNYNPKYNLIKEKRDKISAIIDATSSVDRIFLATDPDREGEAIAWHLAYALESAGKPISRVSFNEITKPAIQKAIKNPKDLDKDLYDAQQARRVVDRIVGFLGSDFLRESFGENLSAGRVQSVAVKLIVDRDREIDSFKKEEYWNIHAHLQVGDQDLVVKLQEKVSTKEEADKIKNELQNAQFIITNVDSKKKNRKPNPPFTTSTLQKAASSQLNMSVSKTMSCAQSLYEIGLITYLRTDSPRISPEAVTMVRDWIGKNNYIVIGKPNVYGTKGSAQDAHECIRPTDIAKLPGNIFVDDEQRKVYKLIWQRFVSCQMEDAVYDTVSVTVRTNTGRTFKASGKMLVNEGWLAVSPYYKQDDDGMLPVVKVKQSFNSSKIDVEQKFTKPPARLGEAALVEELEKRGIGRPSTYASIIERIRGRDYVEIKGKTYRSTELGRKVIDKLNDYFSFMDYNYTAEMEQKLDLIADGKLEYVKMLDDFFIPFQKECKKAEQDSLPDYGFNCDKCNGKMLLKHGRFGYYMSCIERPKCNFTFSVDVVDGKPIKKEDFKYELLEGYFCPKCSCNIKKIQGKFGPYGICENSPRCDGKITRIPYGKKCPACNDELYLTVLRGQPTLSCCTYPQCLYNELAEGTYLNPKELPEKNKNKSIRKVLDLERKNN